MENTLTGTIIHIMQAVGGTSKAGKEWTKQDFVVETPGQYPRKVCFSTTNIDALAVYDNGDAVTVSFNPESREHNGRWYTELRAWKILKAQ